MKKAIIALLCAAILAGGGYFGYRTYIKQRDEKKVVDVVPVNMMAQSEDMFMYSGTDTWGYINAANAQKIYVDTNKLVQKVCVRQGDTVKKGDTLIAIAKQYGTTYKVIAAYNGISNPSLIFAGQQIRIPPSEPGRKTVDELAREVIRGLWGNGTNRKNRLTAAGYDYYAVQARVNELLR